MEGFYDDEKFLGMAGWYWAGHDPDWRGRGCSNEGADGPAPGRSRLATFDVDATPPVGSLMACDPVKRIDEMSLRCRGIVLLGPEQPIVLCAVDWIGIANEGHDAFCAGLAEAAGTVPQRVAVHTIHQHDAPGCDFTAERLIRELGEDGLWPIRRNVPPHGQ